MGTIVRFTSLQLRSFNHPRPSMLRFIIADLGIELGTLVQMRIDLEIQLNRLIRTLQSIYDWKLIVGRNASFS